MTKDTPYCEKTPINGSVAATPRHATPTQEPPCKRITLVMFYNHPSKSFRSSEMLKLVNENRFKKIAPGTMRKTILRLTKDGFIRAYKRGSETLYRINGAQGKEMTRRYLEGWTGIRGGGGLTPGTPPTLPSINVHRQYKNLKTKIPHENLKMLIENGTLSTPNPNDPGVQRKLETDNMVAVISEKTRSISLYITGPKWLQDIEAYLGQKIAEEAAKEPFKQHIALNKREYVEYLYQTEQLKIAEDGSVFGEDKDLEFHGDEGVVRIAMEAFLQDRVKAVELNEKLLTHVDLNERMLLALADEVKTTKTLNERLLTNMDALMRMVLALGDESKTQTTLLDRMATAQMKTAESLGEMSNTLNALIKLLGGGGAAEEKKESESESEPPPPDEDSYMYI